MVFGKPQSPEGEIILESIARGDYRRADKLTRLAALDALHYRVSGWGFAQLLEFIDRVTGGLGYTREEPLDVFRMGLAGSVIAWPEVLRDGVAVLEVGTGLGRTCYVSHYSCRPSLYLTIDVSIEMLAIALYNNPVADYARSLWKPDVIVVWGDAVEVVEKLPDSMFDHVIHDGGPNPRRNPRLYTSRFISQLHRVLKPGGTLSIFAGAERSMQERIYRRLVKLGFEVVEAKHLPWSKAIVFHARRV